MRRCIRARIGFALLLVALFALFTVACGPQLVDDGAEGGIGVPARRLPDGTVLADGNPIELLGAATPAAPLTANRDGYWANAIGFCDPQAEVVMVLDEVRPLD